MNGLGWFRENRARRAPGSVVRANHGFRHLAFMPCFSTGKHRSMSAQQDVPMPTPANRVGRIGYFDVAKGVSIALVAFFHTTGGFVSASIMDSPPALNFLNTMAYGFHVHLFFAISGYFSVRAARRGNSLRNRMLSLYYPYLLWSV